MRERETVETYWAVWIFNDQIGDGHWEEYDVGITTKKAALATMREEQKRYPKERFSIVHTTNRRRTNAPRAK